MPVLTILSLVYSALDLIDKAAPIINNINLGEITPEEQQALKDKIDSIRARLAQNLPKGPEWEIRPD